MQSILSQFAAKGIRHQMLSVSRAFHSPLLEPILKDFRALRRVSISACANSADLELDGRLGFGECGADARY